MTPPHTAKEEQPSACHVLSTFLVWVRCLASWWWCQLGGYSFFSLCLPSNNRITANCWPGWSLLGSLGWRSDSDLILSLLSDVCILLGPPGPWSLQLGPLAVFLYCSAPRDTFCWAQAVELDLLLGTRSPGCLHCSGRSTPESRERKDTRLQCCEVS